MELFIPYAEPQACPLSFLVAHFHTSKTFQRLPASRPSHTSSPCAASWPGLQIRFYYPTPLSFLVVQEINKLNPGSGWGIVDFSPCIPELTCQGPVACPNVCCKKLPATFQIIHIEVCTGTFQTISHSYTHSQRDVLYAQVIAAEEQLRGHCPAIKPPF